jgi:hypothetical protein
MFDLDPTVVAQAQAGMAAHIDTQQRIGELLEQIAQSTGPGLQTIAITEQELGGGYEVDFPVEGAKRWLVPRLATGGEFAIPTSLVKVLDANNRRLGGSIVNLGENPVRLVCANPRTAASQAGLGVLWLRGLGGSWDFRLASMLWCGSVCAIGLGGASTLAVVEV